MSNEERLLKVLLGPLVSEKATNVAMHRQYVFKVLKDATKTEVKKAVELLFKVNVTAVQISNAKGKVKSFARIKGWRKGYKKAYVTLKDGQNIDFSAAR